MKSTEEASQFSVRLPLDIRMRMQKSVKRKGRSLNAEIVTRLNYMLDMEDDGDCTLGDEVFDVETIGNLMDELKRLRSRIEYVCSEQYQHDLADAVINIIKSRF